LIADFVVMPDETGLGNVATFGCVDAIHMTDAFAVLGILPVGDVHAILHKPPGC
jgi:hypothetical protein